MGGNVKVMERWLHQSSEEGGDAGMELSSTSQVRKCLT